MGGNADRVAHVVEGVEHRDQIEARAVIVLTARNFETQIALAVGCLARVVDRGRVEIDANEIRLREGLSHDNSRGAVAAADIGDFAA
jgi:hypothetical protein